MARRNLPVLPDGFADPGLPKGTFSASQYGLYKNCPKAYEFSYVEGIKQPPSGAMFAGVTVHAGVEAALNFKKENDMRVPDLAQIHATLSDEFDKGKDDVVTWEDGLDAGTTKDKVLRLYRGYHTVVLPGTKPIAVEQAVIKRIGTVPTVGYLDSLDAGKGFVELVDVKSSKRAWSQADADKSPQMTLYSVATGIDAVRIDNLVARESGSTDCKQLSSTRDAQAKRNLVEDYEETADLVKRGVFPKTTLDSWMCNEKWCGYYGMCRGRRE
jgi:putative RecB family exonuclease